MLKTNHGYARILFLCLLATAVISITACTKGKQAVPANGNGMMNVDLGEDGMIRNGTEYRTYQLEKGQKGIISVRISKESGRLDMDVYPVDSKDTPNYTGRDLDSASFDVIVEDPGEYAVCLTATKYVGDYTIHWQAEANTDK